MLLECCLERVVVLFKTHLFGDWVLFLVRRYLCQSCRMPDSKYIDVENTNSWVHFCNIGCCYSTSETGVASMSLLSIFILKYGLLYAARMGRTLHSVWAVVCLSIGVLLGLPCLRFVVVVCRDTVSGLEYMHFNRLAHLDLKPENLLMAVHGVVKISDFGSAVLAEPGAKST